MFVGCYFENYETYNKAHDDGNFEKRRTELLFEPRID